VARFSLLTQGAMSGSSGSILNDKTCWKVHDRVKSALLIDGRDYYRAFYSAALTAKKSILLMGWQFDSDVELLRGEDLPEGAKPEDVRLLSLLDRLCRARPDLQVRVLAWDHSVVFALERELLQRLYFEAITCEGFSFRWDNTVPMQGSHHQKVAIIDGRIAFFGSQDICQARWDDSSHRARNELRTTRGEFHQPYHEVQVALVGRPVVRSFVDLFVWRWRGATNETIDVTRLIDSDEHDEEFSFPATLPMVQGSRFGIARTIPEVENREYVDEVSKLYVAAIDKAERFIYIESQYLTSCAVRDALIARMHQTKRPKLDIIVVLPHKPEKFKEEMTVGIPQAVLLKLLSDEAKEHGHALGIYNVVTGQDDEGEPMYVYIHSKLMIVDDELFLVGSANLTNRSMTIDSEIVGAYEANGDRRVRDAIRRARVRLMLEHAGPKVSVRDVVHPTVAKLDARIEEGRSRFTKHDVDSDAPSPLTVAVHELTLEFLDPWDGHSTDESCPVPSSSSLLSA
jgi:phospholipase D1/2